VVLDKSKIVMDGSKHDVMAKLQSHLNKATTPKANSAETKAI
jgi:hypothetical protein